MTCLPVTFRTSGKKLAIEFFLVWQLIRLEISCSVKKWHGQAKKIYLSTRNTQKLITIIWSAKTADFSCLLKYKLQTLQIFYAIYRFLPLFKLNFEALFIIHFFSKKWTKVTDYYQNFSDRCALVEQTYMACIIFSSLALFLYKDKTTKSNSSLQKSKMTILG